MNGYILLGIIFSAFVNNFFIGEVVKSLWKNAGRASERKSRYNLHTSILGGIEGTLYFFVVLIVLETYQENKDSINLLLIVGAWLTLKTLSSVWDKKGNPPTTNKNEEDNYWPGERFNIFLIGTSLNVLSSSATAYTVFLMQMADNYNFSVFSLIVPAFTLSFLYKIIRQHPGD